jgi:hypothetical protein
LKCLKDISKTCKNVIFSFFFYKIGNKRIEQVLGRDGVDTMGVGRWRGRQVGG